MRRSRRGVSLFELLVVMMVLAILVTLVVSLGRHADLQSKRHQALADLGRWQEALHRYYLVAGEYPSYNGPVSNLLTVRCYNVSSTMNDTLAGQMTSTNTPIDPWRHDYLYLSSTNDRPQSFDLYSWGPNSNNPTAFIRLGR